MGVDGVQGINSYNADYAGAIEYKKEKLAKLEALVPGENTERTKEDIDEEKNQLKAEIAGYGNQPNSIMDTDETRRAKSHYRDLQGAIESRKEELETLKALVPGVNTERTKEDIDTSKAKLETEIAQREEEMNSIGNKFNIEY